MFISLILHSAMDMLADGEPNVSSVNGYFAKRFASENVASNGAFKMDSERLTCQNVDPIRPSHLIMHRRTV
jgi:hypothetical protein